MLTQHRILRQFHENTYLPSMKSSDFVLLDIETTGLSARTSHLYLVGAAYVKNDIWHMKQWFLQRPSEEADLLHDLAVFLAPFQTLIHYNGLGFDIPYLVNKYHDYKLTNPFETKDQIDLYRVIKPWQKHLGLASLKQQAVQEQFQISRTDHSSGKDLIQLYRDYLSSGDEEILKLLYQHNADDVAGMFDLLPLLSYNLNKEYFCKSSEMNTVCQQDEKQVMLTINQPYPVPKPVRLDYQKIAIYMDKDVTTIQLPVYSGELKHFYPDYKNYYYLPDEDQAIHKSVGCYVDKQHRTQAKASTCYQRKTGRFIPCTCKQSQQPLF